MTFTEPYQLAVCSTYRSGHMALERVNERKFFKIHNLWDLLIDLSFVRNKTITALCPFLPLQHEIHRLFIQNCRERLKPSEEWLNKFEGNQQEDKTTVSREARKITLCLKALKEYVAESDINFPGERVLLPHFRYLGLFIYI